MRHLQLDCQLGFDGVDGETGDIGFAHAAFHILVILLEEIERENQRSGIKSPTFLGAFSQFHLNNVSLVVG